MKTNFLLLFPALPLFTALGLAQAETERQLPPPVAQAAPQVLPQFSNRPENQRLYGPSPDTLIRREVANEVLEKFRQVYAAGTAPRLVIYVNRELVDITAGLKLSARTENYEKTTTRSQNDTELPAPAAGTPQTQINVSVGGNVAAGPVVPAGKGTVDTATTKTSGTNTYAVKDSATATLADKQTVREIERLFGRAFRNGGAKLADQATAVALLADKEDSRGRLIGDRAAKDRAALASIADIAIEVLISSRNLTVPEVSGDKTHAVPDIQATAIRLKDSAIVGQASASDVLGKDAQAGRIVNRFDVRDITEATALALMEDMLTGAK